MPATGAAANSYVLSATQSAGHGRLGRSWQSPEGGLYLSLLLAEPCAAAEAVALPLISALACQAALASLAALTAQQIVIKWPNDLMVVADEPASRAKLAGIIVTSRGNRVVIGIGVNIMRPPPQPQLQPHPQPHPLPDFQPQPQPDPQPQPQADSAAAADQPFAYLADYFKDTGERGRCVPSPQKNTGNTEGRGSCVPGNGNTEGRGSCVPGNQPGNQPGSQLGNREAAAAALIAQLEQALAQWRAHGYSFAPFRQAYESQLDQLGKDVDVYGPNGNLLAAGRVLGVDEHGYLSLQTNSGEKQIAAGQVTLRQNGSNSAKLS